MVKLNPSKYNLNLLRSESNPIGWQTYPYWLSFNYIFITFDILGKIKKQAVDSYWKLLSCYETYFYHFYRSLIHWTTFLARILNSFIYLFICFSTFSLYIFFKICLKFSFKLCWIKASQILVLCLYDLIISLPHVCLI